MYLFTKKQKIISIVKNLKNDSVSLFLLAFKDKINVIDVTTLKNNLLVEYTFTHIAIQQQC